MTRHGALLALVLALAAPLALSGCGWTPLYADSVSGPGDAALRAISVTPISNRIGQRLELGLREDFNPHGIPTPSLYTLRTTLQLTRQDLGIQSEGLGSIGKIDITAGYQLIDIKTGAVLLNTTTHVAHTFDILSSGYATVVAEDDADRRAIAELREEMVTRLTLFLQRRAAAGKPS
jgi:LPS-assembly lipoprotein